MRKSLIIILLTLLAIASYAQPCLTEKEYYLGAQGGIMASWVHFSPRVQQNVQYPMWGTNAGLVFRYAGHKVCGLQTELNYMQRGWNEPQTGYQRELDYLELSFLSHISFGKRFRGFINLGPQIGYCFRDVTLQAGEGSNAHQYAPIDKPFDWGVAAGLGMLYRTKKAGVFQLEARFNYSLGDIFNNHANDYFSASNPMNASLNFAYLWEFHSKSTKQKSQNHK